MATAPRSLPQSPLGSLSLPIFSRTVRKVVEEEGAGIDVRVRVVETAGTSLRQQLMRTYLAVDNKAVSYAVLEKERDYIPSQKWCPV